MQIGRKALDPPGEARPDWQIIQDISNRVGLPMDYSHPSEIFDELVSLMPNYARPALRQPRARPASSIPTPTREHSDGTVVLFDERFGTDDGLAHLVPAEWLPAKELPSDEYPFILNTGRLLEHWHTGSMTRRSFALDAIQPEAHVFMNPDDAQEMGVADGDFVRVTSRRGTIELRARLSHRDTPGHVLHAVPLPRGGGQPADDRRDRSDRARSPSSSSARCRIERAGGASRLHAREAADAAREGRDGDATGCASSRATRAPRRARASSPARA